MIERLGDGLLLALNFIIFRVVLVPKGHHFPAFFNVLRRDDLGMPVRVLRFEAVAVVALGLQLFAAQLGQLFDGVDIVERIAVRCEPEAARILFLQKCLCVRRHAAEARLAAAPQAVVQHCVHRRAQVALPGGEEIDVAALPVQVLRDEVAHAADLAVVIRPEQHTRKRIVCARLVGCVKDRLNPALVADGDIMKIDHKNPSFFCYVSLI